MNLGKYIFVLALIVSCVSCSIVGNWWVSANGYSGELAITSVDTSGNLVGTFFGNTLRGFYSAHENKITFIRLIDVNSPSSWQTYIGYYHSRGSEEIFGYFEAFGTPAFNRIGWSAWKVTPDSLLLYATPQTPTSFLSGTWTSNSNGYTGNSIFTFLSNGNIIGNFLGSTIYGGFWDQASRSVVFVIETNTNDVTTQQFYRGYLTQYALGSSYQNIDGYFVALSGTGATADVTEYGWSASIQIPSASTGTLPPIH